MSEDVSVEILLVVISLSTSLDLAVEPIVRSCLALLGVIAHLLPVLEDELTAGPPVRAADVLTDLLTQLLYLPTADLPVLSILLSSSCSFLS